MSHMGIPRDFTPLIEATEKLLQFQYNNLGYGKFSCSSCGSLMYVDYGDHDTPTTEKAEECSKNCPWRKAKEAIAYLKSLETNI